MARKELTVDSEFIVGEEKVLDFILTALFFGLFVYGLVDAIMQHFNSGTYIRYVCIVALIPAILFFKKGISKRVYIRINKTGIYQDEKLVTRWANFIKAYVNQKESTRLINIQDNFQLVIEYTKEGENKGFRRKIPLTNTQNKSEEDVLAAVMFFWKVDTGIYTIEN
jgi:hypothetical protein